MRIILMRHGTKDRSSGARDEHMPLSEEGKKETEQRANLLLKLGLRPDLYFTSHFQHAEDTAKLLADQLGDGAAENIKKLCALTPHSRTETFEEIIEEARSVQTDLSTAKLVVFVGHEPRLSQLVTRLTSSRTRPFGRAELVSIAADSFAQLLSGHGKIEFRYPVVNHGEGELRGKIQSKTTVSTFLAGFTATALVELLRKDPPFSMADEVAVVSLTGSLALFIAAVYMYDRLSMPEGFWVEEDRPISRIRRGKTFEENLRANGPLYALMIWTWNYVFTPAVALGLAGFVAMLISTGDSGLWGGAFLALVGAGMWYLLFRPRLGTD